MELGVSSHSRQPPSPLSLVSEGGVEDSSPDSYYTEFPSVLECLMEGAQIILIRAGFFFFFFWIYDVPGIVLSSLYT